MADISIAKGLFHSANTITDPGDAKTINTDFSPGIINLISAAAETRTLDRPTKPGAILALHMQTRVGGNITLTVTGGYDTSGSTTITFSAEGQVVVFMSFVTKAGVYFWRMIASWGGTSQSTGTFADLTVTNAAITNAQITTLSANMAVSNSKFITMGDGANMALGTTSGTEIGTAANQKLGLFGATPVVQPATTGVKVGSSPLIANNNASSVYVTNETAFNGNSGNKSYTINDIVFILKSLGAAASSS